MTEYIYIYIIKSTKFVKIKQNLTSFNSKEEIKMRVTIDLDRDIIIIPDNFFKKIGEENEKEMDNSSALPQRSDYDDRNFCQSR